MMLARPGVALVLPVVARYSYCAHLSYCAAKPPWARVITATKTADEVALDVISQGSSRRAKRRIRNKSKGVLNPRGVIRAITEESVISEKEEDKVVSDRTERCTESEHDPGEVAGLRIVKYPHPSLRAKNAAITEFTHDLQQLSRNMFEIMYAANGVGLAAPQVGLNKRLIVFNTSGDKELWTQEVVLMNPKIVDKSETEDLDEEGCLSFPKMSGVVPRSTWIKVEYNTVQGKPENRKLIGLEARVFQHEYDHIEGVLYIDRLARGERKKVQGRLDELIKDYGYGRTL